MRCTARWLPSETSPCSACPRARDTVSQKPALSDTRATVAGSGPGHTVIHVYGQQHELNNPLSTIIVRACVRGP